MKKKDKEKRKKLGIYLVPFVVLIVVLLIATSYFFPPGQITATSSTTITTTQSPITYQNWNCDDMQIDVNSVKEALAYYKFGIQRPAPENYKLEILSMAVTNKARLAKDFSGHRLELVADSVSSAPLIFNEIEKIVLLDGTIIDYSCRELPLAYISRFELNPGESRSGCKIFAVTNNVSPKLLLVYNVSGLKCSIQI